MKTGDLFRFIDTYDIHNIGVGSIGLIVGISEQPDRNYFVLINGRNYTLPFHHVEEVK